MKTFKLKSLKVIEDYDDNIQHKDISLIDGLIINREDDKNQWVIEGYTDMNYYPYFKQLEKAGNETMLQVKITKESNAPAIFITKIISLNRIREQMNVLFLGTIIDHQKEVIEEILQSLIEESFQGEELLKQFKKKLKKT